MYGYRLVRYGDLAAYAAGVPTSCRRPGHFLLLAQEKVTKEKGPPESAPIGQKPDRYADGFRAFRRGSCPDEKESASLPIPLRAFSPPAHRLIRGPEDQKRKRTARAALLHIASRQVALLLL